MPNDFWSTPDSPMGKIENPSEHHLPCAIICDVSGSMAKQMDAVNESLVSLLKTVFDDNTARGRVEISIFAYDYAIKMVTPFKSIYDYKEAGFFIPKLTTRRGKTSTYTAMQKALDAVNERRRTYQSLNTPHYHPVFFLLTDGWATDTPEDGRRTAFDELLDLQRSRNWNYVPIAIGDDCNIEELGEYQKDHKVISIEKTPEAIRDVFGAMSESLVSIGNSKSGENVYVPMPGRYSSIKLAV